MKSSLWWLGLIFGTLSVVMLIKHGFDYGFVAPLQLMLDFYEQAMQVLFGWAEPWIRGRLVEWKAWIGLELHLASSWKYFFVLMMLVVGVSVRINLANPQHPDYAAAIFAFVVGLFISALTGVVCGSLSTAAHTSQIVPLLILAVPIVGLAAFFLLTGFYTELQFSADAEDLWGGLKEKSRFALAWLVYGGIIIGGLSVLLNVRRDIAPEGAALASLATFIVGMAFLMLMRDIWFAIYRNEGRGRLRTFRGRTDGGLAISILASAVGAVAFLAINAGLKLAGL